MQEPLVIQQALALAIVALAALPDDKVPRDDLANLTALLQKLGGVSATGLLDEAENKLLPLIKCRSET